jgi:FkbM family methyltransferase
MLMDYNSLVNKYNMNVTGVIHIGAHYGEELDIYLNYPSIKNIILFEPDPDSFQRLLNKVNDPIKISCINVALGSEHKRMTFYRSTGNNGQSNSILEPHLHKTQYPHIIFNSTCEVDVCLLDEYNLDSSYNLINMDVQGFELEVLKGSINTIKNVDYIITEVNRDKLYKDGCVIDEVDNFLTKYGFARVEVTWDGVTWGDAFYIRSDK